MVEVLVLGRKKSLLVLESSLLLLFDEEVSLPAVSLGGLHDKGLVE